MPGGISIPDCKASVAETLRTVNAVQGFSVVAVVSNDFPEDSEAPSPGETPCLQI